MAQQTAAPAGVHDDAPAGPFYGTFLEHWPPALCALSMPHEGCVLAAGDAQRIASCEGSGRRVAPGAFSPALVQWLRQALDHFPEGLFLRLGGRSFVAPDRPPQRVHTLDGALAVLGASGERAARMAQRCRLAGRPLWLFARAWRDMQPHEEFRLLLQGGALRAASQYHHRLCFAPLLADAPRVASGVVDIAARIAAVLHLRDAVADVWIPATPGARAELIELNPAMRVTGRALIDEASIAQGPPALHLLGADGAVVRHALPRRS